MAGWTHLKGNGRGNGEHNEIPGEREAWGHCFWHSKKRQLTDGSTQFRVSVLIRRTGPGPDELGRRRAQHLLFWLRREESPPRQGGDFHPSTGPR